MSCKRGFQQQLCQLCRSLPRIKPHPQLIRCIGTHHDSTCSTFIPFAPAEQRSEFTRTARPRLPMNQPSEVILATRRDLGNTTPSGRTASLTIADTQKKCRMISYALCPCKTGVHRATADSLTKLKLPSQVIMLHYIYNIIYSLHFFVCFFLFFVVVVVVLHFSELFDTCRGLREVDNKRERKRGRKGGRER